MNSIYLDLNLEHPALVLEHCDPKGLYCVWCGGCAYEFLR